MKLILKKKVLILTFLTLLLLSYSAWKAYYHFCEVGKVKLTLLRYRDRIEMFKARRNEYPILKNSEFNFWDMSKNELIQAYPLLKLGVPHRQGELNPLTGKLDWLVLGTDGKIYSKDMPDSVLIASPAIRFKNVLCSLTATSPPLFIDLSDL
jgi:hypothetical protein